MNSKQIIKKIKEFPTIIIHRHVRPDGDAIGSSLGLREIIKANFPKKNVYSVGDGLPKHLALLGSEDEVSDDAYDNALVIVVDTSNSNRIADERYSKAKFIIKIDHHIETETYGNINYVLDSFPACCAIIAKIACDNNLKMPGDASKYLYFGLITDTGRFRYIKDNEVFKYAYEILKNPVDIEKMYADMYMKSPNILQLTGYVYNNFKTTTNGVAHIFFKKDVYSEYGCTYEEASGLVNTLDGIEGSLIWILFIEEDDKIRVRARSRFVGVDKLANKYSGGGHKNAAGATVYSLDEMNCLLEDADLLLKQFKKDNPGLN